MKKVNPSVLIDWWLEKYHGTNLKEVSENNPEWIAEPEKHSHNFYEKYAVTQEQHDEWEVWAKAYTKKTTGVKGKMFDRSWGLVYLNVAPQTK